VSDDYDTEILGSVNDVLTTILCKQLLSCPLVYTENDTCTEEAESSELHSTDDKTNDTWHNADKITKEKPCLGITGLKMVINNSESVVEVVSSITNDNTKQLFTEQSDLYRCQNSQWNVSLRTLKWSNIRTDEMGKFLGLTIMMGQVRIDNIR